MKTEQNAILRDHHTFAIGDTSAEKIIEVYNIKDFRNAVENNSQIFILGGGSNVIFASDWAGSVIKNKTSGIEIVSKSGDEIELKVASGENWHDLVTYCVERNYGGIENLALIPGTVGASPVQNIGAYGVEAGNLITKVEYIDYTQGIDELKSLTQEECRFGYRDSVFKQELKNKAFITHVYFSLTKNNHNLNTTYRGLTKYLDELNIKDPSILDIYDAVIAIRKAKLPDPAVEPNSGSFFKNPIVNKDDWQKIMSEHPDCPFFEVNTSGNSNTYYKIPAAWLIQTCGLKGHRDGDLGTHPKQPLAIVNYGKATGEELKKFIKKIQDKVDSEFGIELECEVNIL